MATLRKSLSGGTQVSKWLRPRTFLCSPSSVKSDSPFRFLTEQLGRDANIVESGELAAGLINQADQKTKG